MEYNVQTVLGPRTASISKEDALVELQTHPDYPKNAIVANFDEQDGQWVAKLRIPKTAETKESAPPPPGLAGDTPVELPAGPDGPSKDEDDSSDAPSPDESEKPSDEKSEDGPPKPGDDEGKPPSVEQQVTQLTHLVQQIADALGVAGAGGPPHPGAGPEVGGLPAPPAGGPGAGHAGPGRPPQGPGGQSAMMRARPLKPGEAPNSPGVTPVGAPAFASVAPDDHPWKDLVGKTASFTVSSEIPEDEPSEGLIARSTTELKELAEPVGYKIAQVREGRTDDGTRVVKALVSAR
jgi:hypothetical protein